MVAKRARSVKRKRSRRTRLPRLDTIPRRVPDDGRDDETHLVIDLTSERDRAGTD
jgi:hypothetical protein